jgi:hypothetical protein
MTDAPEAPTNAKPPAGLSWLEAWIMAVTRPNTESYQLLADDPNSSLGRAIGWTVIAGIASGMLGVGAQLLFGGLTKSLAQLEGAAPGTDFGALPGAGLGLILCAVPLGVLFSAIGLLVYTGLTQFIAGAFGGKGTFTKLAYVVAAFSAPMAIAGSLLAFIPLVSCCLTLPLSAYSLALNLMAIKVVNSFGWGKAAATLGTIAVIMVLLGAITILGIISLIHWGTGQTPVNL